VEGRTQQQLKLQGPALPPGARQQPAASGVEEIALMHALPIHPQFGCISPPTQEQTGLAIRG
jgi:hypothetical protein